MIWATHRRFDRWYQQHDCPERSANELGDKLVRCWSDHCEQPGTSASRLCHGARVAHPRSFAAEQSTVSSTLVDSTFTSVAALTGRTRHLHCAVSTRSLLRTRGLAVTSETSVTRTLACSHPTARTQEAASMPRWPMDPCDSFPFRSTLVTKLCSRAVAVSLCMACGRARLDQRWRSQQHS